MVRIRYYRVERNRIDSVVLMLPDPNACLGLMPTVERFKELEELTKNQLNNKLAAIDAEEFVPPPNILSAINTASTATKESNSIESDANASKANNEGSAVSSSTELAATSVVEQQEATIEV